MNDFLFYYIMAAAQGPFIVYKVGWYQLNIFAFVWCLAFAIQAAF